MIRNKDVILSKISGLVGERLFFCRGGWDHPSDDLVSANQAILG